MKPSWQRTALLVGENAVRSLERRRVAVFGVGGVGSYAVEAIARCGVGGIDLYDGDVVSETNINRQLIALHSTIGRCKVDVMAERIRDINPECAVAAHFVRISRENRGSIDLTGCDYVVDAVDMVTAKLIIIEAAHAAGVSVLSAMGAGNRLAADRFEVTRIENTKNDPLARVMRRELRRRGISGVKVAYSPDLPLVPLDVVLESKKVLPGSISYVPATMGLLIAGEVIKDLLEAEMSIIEENGNA